MMKFILLGTTLCTAFLSGNAFASEVKDMAAGIKCLPANKIIKLASKFDSMKPEKKNTVSVTPEMQLTASEGTTLPERVYFRAGTSEHKFNMDKDGVVTDFARIGTMNKKGELCMQGQQFIGKAEGESGMNLSISFDIRFKNSSGSHSLAQLIDGAKDGKSYYKKMFPGPMSIMVPKMTHVGITYLDNLETAKPNIYAAKAGNKIDDLLVEQLSSMYVVSIKDLKNLGADTLKIDGGKYQLTPIPSIEKMKKLGFGGGNENEETE